MCVRPCAGYTRPIVCAFPVSPFRMSHSTPTLPLPRGQRSAHTSNPWGGGYHSMSAPEYRDTTHDPGVSLTLVWDGPRELIVDTTGAVTSVTAHAELSEANIRSACAHLEPEVAERVMAAWQSQLTELPHQRGV